MVRLRGDEMNVITATYKAGSKSVRTDPLWQYDYGQVLKFAGIDLPEQYEVHFSIDPRGYALTVLGDANGALIPDEYLQQNAVIYAWLFLHNDVDDGETKYQVTIPVQAKAMAMDDQPTPVQQSAISQAMSLLEAFRNDLNGGPSYSELVERVEALETAVFSLFQHENQETQ